MQHGIRYEHFPELGGNEKPSQTRRNTAWRNASFRGYADYMETGAIPQRHRAPRSILLGKPDRPRSCARKLFGGGVIAH